MELVSGRLLNQPHPLIRLGLAQSDLYTYESSWGTHDHHNHGHGTGMAGLALYSDLFDALSHNNKVRLNHRLESVKFLPPHGHNQRELSLSRTINCLGDGHDGVWNIVEQIRSKHQRREILDWYHLMENLHKVGGSNQRLRQAQNFLGQGLVNDAIALFDDLKKKQAKNFQNYLRKHRSRIPDYQLYQELGICIGSGSVESWIKQIGLIWTDPYHCSLCNLTL